MDQRDMTQHATRSQATCSDTPILLRALLTTTQASTVLFVNST